MADSVLGAALASRPGWVTPYELRAVVALRDGRCDAAVDVLMELATFGVEPAGAAERVVRCRREMR